MTTPRILPRLLGAVGLFAATLGLATTADAQRHDRGRDHGRYERDHRGPHYGRHDRGRHFVRHDRCRTVIRHHRRVRVCR